MGDASPSAVDNLIARAHHVLAGLKLDLCRPGEPGQQLGDIDDPGRKSANRLLEGRHLVAAHCREPDRTGGDWGGMRVLQP
jgi:hypothetical protein